MKQQNTGHGYKSCYGYTEERRKLSHEITEPGVKI
jgi:hypothetical protein